MPTVVQLDMDGNTLMANSSATFANSKEEAKEILGSAEKIGEQELLIADSVNKRAIIVDLTSGNIIWEYKSDRYVVDFHLVNRENVTINVRDDAISESATFVRQGSLVIWENNSSQPVSIYSGSTTYDLFQSDPDLNLYGSLFHSAVLDPGERYSYKFVSVGDFNWFVYPDILTGTVSVTRERVSSRDEFIVVESDNLTSPFSSRVLKVDAWGNVIWSFGEAYIVNPRDARPLVNGNVLVSV